MEIMTADTALKKIQRMAYEIAENNYNEKEIILAGIQDNGVIITNVLAGFLKDIFKGEIRIIQIDINKRNPNEVSVVTEKKPVSFENKVVIVIDDVSNSGKTLLYALRPFLSHYPAKVQTMVLVDRSHKKFPITPDFTGLSIATALSEKIVVETENGVVTGANLLEN